MVKLMQLLTGRERRIDYFLIAATILCLLASRRWNQLINPQVWNEDGAQIMLEYIKHGIDALIQPVNGYYITLPKIISAVSMEISFLNYPFISTLIAWLFIVFVGTVIALAPTRLTGKFACAIAVFCIPTDPEVFGLPLYTFWWASLLLFLVALWDDDKNSCLPRILFILLGGLSSPIIVLILPVLYFRIFWFANRRPEIVIASIATMVAAYQLANIINGDAGGIPPVASIYMNLIPTFFGRFLIGNWTDSKPWLWLAGLFLFLVVLWGYIKHFKGTFEGWTLAYLLAGVIMMSVVRVDPAIIHPTLAGPRYFYFPFIIIFWILIQLYNHFKKHDPKMGRIIIAAIVAGVFNAIPAWTREHDDLQWSSHVNSCRFFPFYNMVLQFNGNTSSAWVLKIRGEDCVSLLKNDIFFTDKFSQAPVYAYTIYMNQLIPELQSESQVDRIISSSFRVDNPAQFERPGFQILTSNNLTEEGTAEITLNLRRGDKLVYKGGLNIKGQKITIAGFEDKFLSDLPPTDNWSTLEFSNSSLPEKFVLKIEDVGKGDNEWFYIGIKE